MGEVNSREEQVEGSAQSDGRSQESRARLIEPPSGGVARDALKLGRTQPFRLLVRAGFVARGMTYGVIGAIAAALALGIGSTGRNPDQEGALKAVASAPLGKVLLVIASAGLLAYALWKITRGLFGRGPEGGGRESLFHRLGDLGGGLVYVSFAAISIEVLIGAAGNQSREQRSATAGVLGWPGGPLLVGGFGAALIAVSAYQAYAAARGEFTHDNRTSRMSEPERHIFLTVGRIGLIARAAVFGLVGYFLVRTAVDYKTEGGVGIDGTLAELHQQPIGPWLLGLAALGLLVFAAFSFFEARYQHL